MKSGHLLPPLPFDFLSSNILLVTHNISTIRHEAFTHMEVRGTNVELANDSQCQAELCLQAFLLMGQYTMILTILVCDLNNSAPLSRNIGISGDVEFIDPAIMEDPLMFKLLLKAGEKNLRGCVMCNYKS
ncbi:hypothetical protein NC652_002058 [Populus alba x Populus x berolinensis]|nr:hypothetical protein NC652_002058 [Populus alba x Populus x berolinensis]